MTAAAEGGGSDSAAVIDLPPGITMGTLEDSGDPGSASISGCPVGDTVIVREYLSVPLGGSQSAETPIALVPSIEVPADGVVMVPLSNIAEWLAYYQPHGESVVVIEARCGTDELWATQTINREAPRLGAGAPIPEVPTDEPAAPLAAAEPDAPVFIALGVGGALVLVLVGVLILAGVRGGASGLSAR